MTLKVNLVNKKIQKKKEKNTHRTLDVDYLFPLLNHFQRKIFYMLLLFYSNLNITHKKNMHY